MVSKNTILGQKYSINCNGKLLNLNEPVLMGILNITPDSFYDGGKYNNEVEICNQVEKMISEGASIIDLGASSSRPGAEEISEKEELKRLDNSLKIIKKRFSDIFISIDTYRSEVAKKMVLNYNIDIINDISAGSFDEKMFETISELQMPYIMMHMQGKPSSMQNKPAYKDVVQDIIGFFSKRIEILRNMGVSDIILDPGFGFGKTIQHNYEILNKLENFKVFDLPVLVGASRKSFIYKPLNLDPEFSLNATTAFHTISLLNGSNILRVHDVKEAKEAIKIVKLLKEINN